MREKVREKSEEEDDLEAYPWVSPNGDWLMPIMQITTESAIDIRHIQSVRLEDQEDPEDDFPFPQDVVISMGSGEKIRVSNKDFHAANEGPLLHAIRTTGLHHLAEDYILQLKWRRDHDTNLFEMQRLGVKECPRGPESKVVAWLNDTSERMRANDRSREEIEKFLRRNVKGLHGGGLIKEALERAMAKKKKAREAS